MNRRVLFFRSIRSVPLGLVLLLALLTATGCAPEQKALGLQRESVGEVFQQGKEEYFVPVKPVDRHYIGSAWSRQFGPVEDPATADIRVKTERSLDKVQQDMAYSRGIALGGQHVTGAGAAVEVGGGTLKKTDLGGVEIISPVSLADIPFEPKIPYVTEAIRLANFRLKGERSRKATIAVRPGVGRSVAGGQLAEGIAGVGGGGDARAATEGEGLVVAYKLHMIDEASYQRRADGPKELPLERAVDFPGAGLFVKARMQRIEPGTGKSLPWSLLWACPRAAARSRDIVAAWLVEIRPSDPRKKSLTIGFPAFPMIEECRTYSGPISSRIDPVTDRILRQRVDVVLLDADVDDAFHPARWDARISVIDESFNIRQVSPAELEHK